MKNSYDSEELIEDVLEDIELFGEDFNVYAVYSYFEKVDGRLIDEEFITSYVDADEPMREEIEDGPWDEDDEREFQKLMSNYQKGLESLKQTKNDKMTLKELLEKLRYQDKIFKDD